MISLPIKGYLIEPKKGGIFFDCPVAAKVLLTLQSREPIHPRLLATGCLCSETPERQLLDHVPKQSDCCNDRIFLGFNFSQILFSVKLTPRECCGYCHISDHKGKPR